MLVFDLSAVDSYENLEQWRQSFIQTTGDVNNEIPIILIGNKADRAKNIKSDVI